MKLFVVTALILFGFTSTLVFSAPTSSKTDDSMISLVRSEQSVQPDGYKYSYELDNGQKAEETGHFTDDEEFLIHGSFEYTSPEGDKIELQYTADKNGFQPQGAHLPTPPPIPEIILRAVEYLTSH